MKVPSSTAARVAAAFLLFVAASGCISWQDVANSGLLGAGWKSGPPTDQPTEAQPAPPQTAPAPPAVVVPAQPPPVAVQRPADAFAYVGDGETTVTIGSTFEGRTARISGSIHGEATVINARATFAGVARIGDLVECGDLRLKIAVVRSSEVTPW